MGKKGLSLEEKRQKLLEVYYERVLQTIVLILTIERGIELEKDREIWHQERSQ